MLRASVANLPESLKLRKLSFVALWNYDVHNLAVSYVDGRQFFLFGYRHDDGEGESISRVCTVVKEMETFELETRSMIWRIAEIRVERQNEWLIFSRHQDDLSPVALSDFLVDCRNYLEHLREADGRLLKAERVKADSLRE